MSEQLTDIKQRFEAMKSLESFKKLAPTELFFDDMNYLIQQAERIQEFEDAVYGLQETYRQEREYNERLLNKVKHYERALRKISYCEFEGWYGSEILGKVTDFATETLRES